MSPVALRGRGVKFRPGEPGSLQPTTGGGQFGLTCNEWEQWFVNTNSQHLRHIILPDNYLQRNPLLPVKAVTLDIPDHGAACKVHRISPFEAWRVLRTKQRKDGPSAKNFPSTELVPGGFITSACSPLVYLADLLPKKYHGNVLICDPANNLIHRDVLEPKGVTFVAKRADADCEFMAAKDNYFRPVCMTIGPDGGIYVADFYREVIETPLSLPPDIKKKVNLQSRKRGRIWRIVPEGKNPVVRPKLHKAKTPELVSHLDNRNIWWRITCQRLLIEQQDKAATPQVRKLLQTTSSGPGRAHALWTLAGLNALTHDDIKFGLHDKEAGVREQALRLAEGELAKSAIVRHAVLKLVDDPAPRVRFQLAFTLGQVYDPGNASALAELARKDGSDPWMQSAILSSAHGPMAPVLLKALAQGDGLAAIGKTQQQFIAQLAALVGAAGDEIHIGAALKLLADGTGSSPAPWHMAFLEGLGQGLQRNKSSLTQLWDNPPVKLKTVVQTLLPFFDTAGKTARSDKASLDDRLGAIRLLAIGPYSIAAPVLEELIGPQHAPKIQLAAVSALSGHDNPKVPDIFLKHWGSYPPEVRREVVNALFVDKYRVKQLLGAISAKKVVLNQLDLGRMDLLKKYPDPAIRQQAEKLLKSAATPDRQKVIDKYLPALDLKADAVQGKAVFKKNCAACHKLEGIGFETGPDLKAALGGKSAEDLLIAILDPNREVDPRYLEYIVITKAGKFHTGRIVVETATSITLRRAENAEDVILRRDIATIQATAKSLMPEGLENQLTQQDLADVILYLQTAVKAN
jgi:putative heme-binding domain-containing protein